MYGSCVNAAMATCKSYEQKMTRTMSRSIAHNLPQSRFDSLQQRTSTNYNGLQRTAMDYG